MVAVVALVLTLGACEVRGDVAVTMNADGSGQVSVALVLDAEAAAKVPDLASGLRTEDLAAAGWKIAGPVPTADKGAKITASRSFKTPTEANVILAELSGPDGPFKGLTLARTHSFGKEKYAFNGVLDVSKGTDAFADAFFTHALGAQQADQILGGDAKANPPTVTMSVTLPGSVSAGSAGSGSTARWSAKFGEPAVNMKATSEKTSTSAFLFMGVSIAALVGLLITGALVLVSRIRSHRR
jgi:hypothetical protein